jgi:hypothetical protein
MAGHILRDSFKPVDYKEGERSNLVLSEFHHIVDAAFFIYFSMIFYFSGTGNSKWIANQLSKEQKEELVFIPDALKNEALEFSLQAGEKIGFVFPIYSWAPQVRENQHCLGASTSLRNRPQERFYITIKRSEMYKRISMITVQRWEWCSSPSICSTI